MAVDPRLDGDDALLDALAVALRPAPAEPSMGELAGLHRALAARLEDVGALRRGRRRRRFAAVAGLLVLGSGGTAYATSPSAPREVRSVAHAIRLPVEAPDVTDARKALDDLEEELAEPRVRADKVRAELADVEEELAPLSAGQRAALEPRLTMLLERARAVLTAAAPVEAEERHGGDAAGSEDERESEDRPEVETHDLDDSSGSGSSGSSGSGSSGSGSGSSGSGSSGSGSSGSGSDSGSGSSGSGSSGTSGSGSGSSGSSGSGSSGSGSSGSGSGGDTRIDSSGSGSSGSGSVDADGLDGSHSGGGDD